MSFHLIFFFSCILFSASLPSLKVDEFQSAPQFSDKEVIYSRYDPNLQSYIYYSSSQVPENVSMMVRSIQPHLMGNVELPPLTEEEDQKVSEFEIEKYQMFLKWLEAQKPEEMAKESNDSIPEDSESSHESESDEFHDIVDDADDDEPSTISEPTVKLNPNYYLQNLLEQAEKLAENLPPIEEQIPTVVEEQNAPRIEPDIPSEVRVGHQLIQLETPNSDHSSDEEYVIQSKLTISNSHLELQTMKTGSTGSQTSLNLLVPNEESPSYPSLTSLISMDSKVEKKPALHAKGKASPVPPKMLKASSPKPKKPKLLSSITGYFKSDTPSTSKSEFDVPKETQI